MDRLTNPLVDCEATIKHINLDAWREDPPVGPQPAATATSTTNTGTFSHIISSLPAGGTSHTTVCQVKILFLRAKLLEKSLSCRSDLKCNFTCWYTRQIDVFCESYQRAPGIQLTWSVGLSIMLQKTFVYRDFLLFISFIFFLFFLFSLILWSLNMWYITHFVCFAT